jgi:hypothetical protein
LWDGDEVFGNLVGRGDFETPSSGNDLMLGPGIFEVIKTAPERSYFSLDLECREIGIS